MVISSKTFLPIFSKNVSFVEKIVKLKIFNRYPISHRKGYIHFRRQTSPFLQKRLAPQKRFFAAFSENTVSLKKLLNNKIFSTLFVIKSYVNFWTKRPPFPKKLSNMPPKQFYTFSLKILGFFFRKNCWIKKCSASNFKWKRLYSFLV